MKKEWSLEILDSIFIPLITYLFAGLFIIKLGQISVNPTFFVIWAVMAGLFCAIQKYFSNRAVTMGICIYVAGMVLWFAFFGRESGRVHAVLIMLGFAAIFLLGLLMKQRIIKIFLGFLGLGSMIYCVVLGEEFSKGLVFLALILFLNAVSELIALFYSGNVKSLILIYVLTAALTLFTPADAKPYGWDFVFRMIDSVQRLVDRIVTEMNYQMMDSDFWEVFHIQAMGYSDSDSDMSAGIWESDVEQLILYGDYTKRNLYLKGNTCGNYTPNGWRNQENFSVPDYRIDTLMTLYVLFHETDDFNELRKFMEIKKQEVTFRNIRTESLFYPLKLLDISVDNLLAEGDNLRSVKTNSRGYGYSYSFVDLDYSNPYLINIIRNCGNVVYEEQAYYHIYDVLEEVYGIKTTQIPFEDFIQMAASYEENVRKQYVEEDDGISERTALLSEEISLGCETEYDSCKALEKYLYQYRYNKAVSIPRDVNVPDYFLFEGKEGYCIHYATALAVMLHCRDIPARIAEGFLVDYKKCEDGYTYSISSNRAHAWVEAYLEGFGWIRLEPTVVNAGDANAVWYPQAVGEEEVLEEENEEEMFLEEIQPEDEGREQRQLWVLMIKFLGGMFGTVGMILVVMYMYHRTVVQRSSNPDIVCNYLISVFGRRFSRRKDSETLFEYFERLQRLDSISDELREELPIVKRVMEEYWYGNGNVQKEDIERMRRLSGTAKRTLKKQ